jgi:hypothetical protein
MIEYLQHNFEQIPLSYEESKYRKGHLRYNFNGRFKCNICGCLAFMTYDDFCYYGNHQSFKIYVKTPPNDRLSVLTLNCDEWVIKNIGIIWLFTRSGVEPMQVRILPS